jgi:hypothetical protein
VKLEMDTPQSAVLAAARQLLESSVDANPAAMDEMWDLLGRYRRVLAKLLAAHDSGPARPASAHASPGVFPDIAHPSRSIIEREFASRRLPPLRMGSCEESQPGRTLQP